MSPGKRAFRVPSKAVGSSQLLWVLWLIWLAAIVYGSLWPWQAWRDHGLAPWAFIADPWPRYWTWFDISSNVFLYLPLGLLLAGNLRGAAWLVVLASTLIGALLSGLIEAAQSYLPQRIPSLLDCATNTLGSALGASLAIVVRSPWAKLQSAVRGWWKDDATIPAAMIVGWVALQIFWFLAQSGLTDLAAPLFTAGLASTFSPASTPAWRMLESVIISLLIVHAAAQATVRWASLVAVQCLLGLLLLEQLFLRSPASILADDTTLQALWMIIGAWWIVLAALLGGLSLLKPAARIWLGFALACLWPLRSLLRFSADLVASVAVEPGLGPGLGPPPAEPDGPLGVLLALERTLRHLNVTTDLPPAPGVDAAIAFIFGGAVLAPETVSTSLVLGRPWQHFDAVVLAADQTWRWITLAWFSVALAHGSHNASRPLRPRRPQ
jgi:VanZ family protein